MPLCGDSLVEPVVPETFSVRLTGVSLPATLAAPSTAVVSIQDDDGGGTVRFSSAAYAITEGTAAATLTVLRTNGTANVQVPWTLGGTAILGTDYATPTSPQPLTFGPNQGSATITIPIINDPNVDGPKTVVVTLGAPTGGATPGTPSVATLTINDNEPTVRFSKTTYTVGESSTSVTVTVQRLGPPSSPASVTIATNSAGNAEAGTCASGAADYLPVSIPVPFLPGQGSKSVPITLCPDAVADGTETIGLALTNPSGATLGTPNTATILITENDVAGAVQFAGAATTVGEGQTATVLVTRTGGSASAVTAHWTITGGTAIHGVDYEGATSGTVTFGQSPQPINIAVKPRAGSQVPRTITLVLDGAGGGGGLGAQTTTTIWILDGD